MMNNFSSSLAEMKNIIDNLLDNKEGDLRFLRAVDPNLKDHMNNLNKLLKTDLSSIFKWGSEYKEKNYSNSASDLNFYENIANKLIDVLLDETLSQNIPPSNEKIVQRTKNTFSSSNFDPDLPKGPSDIKVFQTNPLEDIINSLTFNNSYLPDNLDINIALEVENLAPPIWVDTEDDLEKISNELKGYSELAIDLENHSFYSFYGFSCLMQVSTREKDYLIDTIALRPFINKYMGSIFASPSILKIFHGAESDIYWLQRDFGIFVARIFDSYYASRKLNLERQSLGYLINYYFGHELDKSFQTSDWRIRPLTLDMIKYAQLDTKCLFSLYDAMRIDLIKKCGRDGLFEVFKRSSRQALNLYSPEKFDERSAIKQIGNLDKKYYSMASSLVNWRQKTAIEIDVCPYAI